MLTAINSTSNFECLRRKYDNEEVQSLKKQTRKQARRGFMAESMYLGGSVVGLAAINKAAYGKRFGWNKILNSSFAESAASVTKRFGNLAEKIKTPKLSKLVENSGNLISKGLEKLSKTSGRKKLLMGGALLALAGYETLVGVVNRKNGKNIQKIEDAKAL